MQETNVICPFCEKKDLKIRFSCLETWFACEACQSRFSLDQLATRIDDEQFDAIEKAISHRLSDRI